MKAGVGLTKNSKDPPGESCFSYSRQDIASILIETYLSHVVMSNLGLAEDTTTVE